MRVCGKIVRLGETLSSSVAGYASRVGGKGANQAVAVVRAGGGSGEGKEKSDGDSSDVWFFGTIGQDGLWIREKMHNWGVNVQNGGLLVDPELTTGRAIIQVDKQGENAIGEL